MRSSLVPLLVPVLSLLAFASPARAGSVIAPLTTAACGDMDVADDAMNDPALVFSGAPSVNECEKLCKKARQQCISHMKKNASCLTSVANEQVSYGQKNCEFTNETGAEVRECKQSIQQLGDAFKDDVKAARELQQEACDEWTDACIASCQVEM
jgi:hypothetical protein